MDDIIVILLAICCVFLGGGLGYLIKNLAVLKDLKERKNKRDVIIERARRDASDIKYHARKASKLLIKEERTQLEEILEKRDLVVKVQEKTLAVKEKQFNIKYEKHEGELLLFAQSQKDVLNEKKRIEREIFGLKDKQLKISKKLTEVGQMTREEAKKELIEVMEEDAKVDFTKRLIRLEQECHENAEKESKKIIGIAIQRYAGEYVAEKTIGIVPLPSDDIKGRLIGREGRNIRAFEQICGVDLIIDDTPEAVVISTFNVIRREIAKQTILALIADGRIHPAKISEIHDRTKKEMDKEVLYLGEKAQMEIGVHGIHPEILKLVGSLNWRTSYTQNQYQHALEAAFICGAMAAELGLNIKQGRRAALLHDIGKVLDASAEGSHAMIGADFAKKFGESQEIVHAIRSHHEDEKPESILAHLVTASDALSGARPGARKAMMESYVSRLTDIEDIVNSFTGVTKSYALSGGREVRVFVENQAVSDEETVMLSRDIAKKIEEEMSYPGTIKITVLRETKAIGIAY